MRRHGKTSTGNNAEIKSRMIKLDDLNCRKILIELHGDLENQNENNTGLEVMALLFPQYHEVNSYHYRSNTTKVTVLVVMIKKQNFS